MRIESTLAKDSLIRLLSNVIPLILLQFVLLPLVASRLGNDQYGAMLTIVALFTLGPSVLGNSINNVRLIYNDKYAMTDARGDFPFLVVGCSIIALVFMAVAAGYYSGIGIEFFLVILTAVPWLLFDYNIVFYQIDLDFISILKLNIAQCLGYLIGFFLFLLTGLWPLIYLLGKTCALGFFYATYSDWKDPFTKTLLFCGTVKDTAILSFSSLLNNVPTYADRLLIYPVLGGGAVAVYYAASLLGKLLTMAVSPVNNVLLSHLSKASSKNDSMFWRTLKVSFATLFVGCLLTVLLSYPALSFLYPSLAEEALPFVPILALASLFSSISTILLPFILRFFSRMWQVTMNFGLSVLYIALSLFLLSVGFGLWGFCWSLLVTAFARFGITLAIYSRAKESK